MIPAVFIYLSRRGVQQYLLTEYCVSWTKFTCALAGQGLKCDDGSKSANALIVDIENPVSAFSFVSYRTDRLCLETKLV